MATLKINFRGKDYFVSDLTIGKLLDIESLRMTLTNNSYSAHATSKTIASAQVLDLVDSVSVIAILLPDIRKTILSEDKSILDIPLKESKELVSLYRKQIRKWYEENLSLLKEEDEEDKKND